MMGIEKY